MEEHVEISVMEGLAAAADLATKELTAKQVKLCMPFTPQLHSFFILSPFFLHSSFGILCPFLLWTIK